MPRRTRPRSRPRRSDWLRDQIEAQQQDRPLTYERMAMDLVNAGKCSPQILDNPNRYVPRRTDK